MLSVYKSWAGSINAAKVSAAQDATTKANTAQTNAVNTANTLASSARVNAVNDITASSNLVLNTLTVNRPAVFPNGFLNIVPNNGSGNIVGRTSTGFWSYDQSTKIKGWPTDANSWFHLISTTHGDISNYFALQLSASYFENSDLYWRSTNNNGTQNWNKVWSSSNFDPNSKANLSGAIFTGNVSFKPIDSSSIDWTISPNGNNVGRDFAIFKNSNPVFTINSDGRTTFNNGIISTNNVIGSVVRNFPDTKDNMFYASGNGPQLSYCSWFDNPSTKTDTTYVQVQARMKSQQPAELAEYTLSLDSFFNTGYAGPWIPNHVYTLEERVKNADGMYKVVQAGTSSGSSGPTGTGTSINDGSVVWSYVGSSSLDNKAGFNHVTQVGSGAGHVWGSAMNTIQLPGTKSDFVCNVEFDVGNYARSTINQAISYNIWTYGISTFPITAVWANSSPPDTPKVGVAQNWTPNTNYIIDNSTIGAPIVQNAGRYYYLKNSGTSASSGGPTGTQMYVDINDGSCVWQVYDAEFMTTSYAGTSRYLGGLAAYGMLWQGYNSVREVLLMDATHARIGIAADRGAEHEIGFIADYSKSTNSYIIGGNYAYAGLNDKSTAPWGIRQEGNYSAGAYKYRDLIFGQWSQDNTYNVVSFNNTFSSTFLNGWFGKASDPVLYGNSQYAYHLRVANQLKMVVDGNGSEIKGNLVVTNPSNDAIISLESTLAPSNTYRIKQLYSSVNVNGGNSWLFRSIRPSDNATKDAVLDSAGTILTTGNFDPNSKATLGTTVNFFGVSLGNTWPYIYTTDNTNVVFRVGTSTEAYYNAFNTDGSLTVAGDIKSRGQSVWTSGNFDAPTVIANLADAKKRLDQPWGNPVTYYGAVRSQTQDSSAAFQTAANLGQINIPGGDFVIDQSIVTTNSVVIKGAGPYVGPTGSRLLARVPNLEMFKHNVDASLNTMYKEHFHVEGVDFCCMAQGPNRALNLHFNDANFIANDVKFTSFSGNYHWKNFVKIVGGGWHKITRVNADGGSFSDASTWDNQTQVAFDLQSPNNNEKMFGVVFDNCDIMAIQHGVLGSIYGGGGVNGSIEGVIFRDCFGRTAKGPWYRLFVPDAESFWFAPYHIFERVNYEGPGQVCDIDSASEIHVDQCLFYGGKPVPNSTRTPDDFFRIRRFQTLHYTRNTSMMYDQSNNNYLLALFVGEDLWIRDNKFQINSGATVQGGVYLGNGISNIMPPTGNIFKQWNGTPQFNGLTPA